MIKQVYQQVQEHIEADARQRNPGEYLPSELQYASMLAVSRLTVRKAVDQLMKSGLVKRIAGKGLMVGDSVEVQFRGRLLISCLCVVGDADIFRSVLGCVEMANNLKYDYKLLNFSSAKEQWEGIQAEDLSVYDGAIISSHDSDYEAQTRARLRQANIPTIVIGNDTQDMPYVINDDFNGGYLVGEYLVQHGHRDILYIDTDRPLGDVARRKKGFLQALEDNHVRARDELFLTVEDPGTPIITGLSYQRPLPECVGKYLDGTIRYTAIAGYSTLPILSLCYRLHKQGIRFPDDISVVAYGDELYLPWQDLPMTGISENKPAMGAAAVETLHRFLSGESSELESSLLPVRFLYQKSVKTI